VFTTKTRSEINYSGKQNFLFFVPSWLLLTIFVFGCAPGRYEGLTGGVQASPEEAIQNARHYLKTRPDWDIDCSHFVLACYHSREMAVFLNARKYHHNLVYDLNYYLTKKKTRRARAADIRPGDILIFNFTYDINRDGRIDAKDVFTHAGIVEKFLDGAVYYIDAAGSRKPPRLHRRAFSLFGEGHNEAVARDPATGRKILHRETFYAAYAPP